MVVPIVDEDYNLENSIEKLIEKSKIKSTLQKDTIAEGIVIRPLNEMIENEVLKGKKEKMMAKEKEIDNRLIEQARIAGEE